MKTIKSYQCEICGYTSLNSKEVLKCEFSHLGFTSIQQYAEYQCLSEEVARRASVVSRTNNLETRQAYNKAIDKLLDFESNNGVISLSDYLLIHRKEFNDSKD